MDHHFNLVDSQTHGSPTLSSLAFGVFSTIGVLALLWLTIFCIRTAFKYICKKIVRSMLALCAVTAFLEKTSEKVYLFFKKLNEALNLRIQCAISDYDSIDDIIKISKSIAISEIATNPEYRYKKYDWKLVSERANISVIKNYPDLPWDPETITKGNFETSRVEMLLSINTCWDWDYLSQKIPLNLIVKLRNDPSLYTNFNEEILALRCAELGLEPAFTTDPAYYYTFYENNPESQSPVAQSMKAEYDYYVNIIKIKRSKIPNSIDEIGGQSRTFAQSIVPGKDKITILPNSNLSLAINHQKLNPRATLGREAAMLNAAKVPQVQGVTQAPTVPTIPAPPVASSAPAGFTMGNTFSKSEWVQK